MTSEVKVEADAAADSSGPGRSARGQSRKARSGPYPDSPGDEGSGVVEFVQQAGAQAKQSAATLMSEAQAQIKSALDAQVHAGADVVARVAESTKIAAEHLEEDSPHLAGIVHAASDRIEAVARGLKEGGAQDLLGTASDFIRREPAIAFGAAAAIGFALVRLFKHGVRSEADEEEEEAEHAAAE